MSHYKLGQRSVQRLVGVQDPLVRVVKRAITISRNDFMVLEGMRTLERQKTYLETGKSRTLDSYHLTGHAVDLAVYGELPDQKGKQGALWEPWDLYEDLANTMFQAAHIEGVLLQWGGHFCRYTEAKGLVPFLDGVHFQIPREVYPASGEKPKRAPRKRFVKPKNPPKTKENPADRPRPA